MDRRTWTTLAAAGIVAALSACGEDATSPHASRRPLADLSAPDRAARTLSHTVPARVPSGLPVDR